MAKDGFTADKGPIRTFSGGLGAGPQFRSQVLVTGGAGFVGSHLTKTLLAAGHEVHVIDDLSTGNTGNLPDAVVFHLADVRDEARLRTIFASNHIDAVVHCAAQTSVARSMAEPMLDRAINVEGTGNLARLAAEYGAKRFVFISSGGAIYGETPEPATEETPTAPMSHYGANKLEAERRVRASGVSYAILRPANIYGPGQRADLEGGVVAIFMERLLNGGCVTVHGDGRQVRDFVLVGDVVRAIQTALATTEDVTWNVSTGEETSILDLLDAIQCLTNTTVSPEYRPIRAGDIRRSVLSPARLMAAGWAKPRGIAEGLRGLVKASKSTTVPA